ncbi:MAG: ankyrin repeat-containing domain protein [Monoraphidium minutum]|nr:MAG: ankyrin repeat-containing domain protein [Monoraphidium minutum]
MAAPPGAAARPQPPPPPARAVAAQMEGRALLGMARDDKVAEIQAAVELGIPVDFGNPIGQTALMIASLWGNLNAIQALLQLGADPNKANQAGATALHFAAAAKRNAAAACELLVQAGADPTIEDDMGCMPYERADDPKLRTRLGGPDPRLFEFAAANDAEGLRQLLLTGAVKSVRSLDPEGRHALNLAVAANNGTDAIDMLLEADPGGWFFLDTEFGFA